MARPGRAGRRARPAGRLRGRAGAGRPVQAVPGRRAGRPAARRRRGGDGGGGPAGGGRGAGPAGRTGPGPGGRTECPPRRRPSSGSGGGSSWPWPASCWLAAAAGGGRGALVRAAAGGEPSRPGRPAGPDRVRGDAALEDARTRTAEGWALTNDPPRMVAAAAHAEDAVRRAEGLVETGDPDDATRAEVAAARAAVDDLSRHARLLSDAERIIREHAQGFASGSRIRAQRAGSGRRTGGGAAGVRMDPRRGRPTRSAGRWPPAASGTSCSATCASGSGGRRTRPSGTGPGGPAGGQLAAGGPLARWQEALDRKDRDRPAAGGGLSGRTGRRPGPDQRPRAGPAVRSGPGARP